jgi:hypothetical protein
MKHPALINVVLSLKINLIALVVKRVNKKFTVHAEAKSIITNLALCLFPFPEVFSGQSFRSREFSPI